jgi:hypothetical protein
LRYPLFIALNKWLKPFENESKGYLGFGNIIDSPMPAKKASITRLDGSPDRHTDTGMKPTYI